MNQDDQIPKHDLHMLGLKKRNAVLVHSSYKSLAYVDDAFYFVVKRV